MTILFDSNVITFNTNKIATMFSIYIYFSYLINQYRRKYTYSIKYFQGLPSKRQDYVTALMQVVIFVHAIAHMGRSEFVEQLS